MEYKNKFFIAINTLFTQNNLILIPVYSALTHLTHSLTIKEYVYGIAKAKAHKIKTLIKEHYHRLPGVA